MMKNFTLNDDQFEELAKERHCACTNDVNRGVQAAIARSTADRFYHQFEPNSILRFFTYDDITMDGAFRFFSLAKPAAVG
jgi:hypothetical protein